MKQTILNELREIFKWEEHIIIENAEELVTGRLNTDNIEANETISEAIEYITRGKSFEEKLYLSEIEEYLCTKEL